MFQSNRRDLEKLTDVPAQGLIRIAKYFFSLCVIVIVVIVEGLAEEILSS